MRSYRLTLKADDNDTFIGESPDFPELVTFGETTGNVALRAVGAVEEAIAARIYEGEDLPPLLTREQISLEGGLSIALPALTALKVCLYRALRGSTWTRADLARALGWHREQVDRLFRLDHASQIGQIEAAFGKLGQDIDIEIRPRTAA